MQNLDFSKLVQVKLDLSVVQDALSQTIQDIVTRVSNLEINNEKISLTITKTSQETHKLYEIIEQHNEKNGHSFKLIDDQINELSKLFEKEASTQNTNARTPKEVLDHIENRIQLSQNQEIRSRESVKASETIKFKDDIENVLKNDKDQVDHKVYEIYANAIEKIELEVVQLRKDFRNQLSELSNKSTKSIEGKVARIKGDSEHFSEHSKKPSREFETLGTSKNINLSDASRGGKSQKVVVVSTKKVDGTSFSMDPAAPKSLKNLDESPQSNESLKEEIKDFVNELKNEIRVEVETMVKIAEEKFEDLNRTNSVISDNLLETKKSMEGLINEKDSLMLEMAGIKEKSSTAERQLNLVIDSTNEHKNKFKSIESSLTKLMDELKEYKNNGEVIKEEDNEEENNSNGSRNDIFRDSHSSFRSSVAGNLGPIRHNSIVRASNNRIDSVEEIMKQMNAKIANVVERLNKMEDERKRESLGFGSSLPKIDKENKSNINPLEIIRKELKKVNDDILKTNEKLTSTKDKLNELYETHADVPNKIEDIYNKLREYNELQEDRLIELIKELINRALCEPFDNNFTNRLKREINVKFLEIKHEYNCILKEIEGKVENRAEKCEIQKISHKHEESILELKAIAQKKCETEDFKKGIKYLENKIKEVFQFAKSETVALANEQKQYIGARKQSIH